MMSKLASAENRELKLDCIPLDTQRLRLEISRPAHAAGIFESYSSDPEVTRYLRWKPAQTIADSESAMEGRLSRLESGLEWSWILVLKSEDAVIGSVSVWPRGSEAEIGFALAQNAWGRGIAVEAADAVVRWLRESDRVRRVWAACDVDNLRSIRVLERMGLAYERRAEKFSVHPNLSSEPRACLIYSLDLRDPDTSGSQVSLGR